MIRNWFAVLFATGLGASAAMAAPMYQIEDLGLVQSGDFASQGFGVSPGGVAFGRGRARPTRLSSRTRVG